MSQQLDFSLNRLYRSSDPGKPPLRVGVMVDGSHVNRYARHVVMDILDSNFAQVACVIENCTEVASPAKPRAGALRRLADTLRIAEKRRQVLYQLYLRWIDAAYRMTPDPTEMVDCTDLLAGVPRIRVSPARTRFVDRFPDGSVAEIAAQKLDVIFRFGFRIIRGAVLGAARCGVWSFHHDDSSRYRGGPPQLWELMEGNPESGAVLQRLEDALDAGAVLGAVNLSSTHVPSVSVNRFNVYWSTQHLAIQKLHELHSRGAEQLSRRAIVHRCYEGRKPIYRTPDNLEMGRWLLPTIVRKAAGKLARVRPTVPHWRIALRRSCAPLHSAQHPDLSSYTWLDSPRGHFWADPFLVEHEGAPWAFFEDFSYQARRAVIGCGRIDDAGRLTDVRTVLDRPYHLSYPHVFRHEGAVWMVPESCESGSIELYRAVRFPDEWVLEHRLIELAGVDATPFQHQGRWWMFVSPTPVRNHAPLTLLFMAPRLQGPWTLHPASPICSSVRWARSAGQVFADGDALVRPSQDCSNGYGYSVTFNRITRLDEHEYSEERGRTILPHSKQGLAGFHTYNRVGDWEIVDGKFFLARRAIE